MARATRIALDLALVSLRKIGPVVSNIWFSTKRYVEKTPAKLVVTNSIVTKAEMIIDNTSNRLIAKMADLRNHFLPKELKYLEEEVEKVKKKIEHNKEKSTGKTLRPVLGVAWQYAKTEMVPPLTLNFFHGPIGKKLEENVAKVADGAISGLQSRIQAMDAQVIQEKQLKEAEARAAEEKLKNEIIAKKKEEARLAEEAKKAQIQAAKIAKEAKSHPDQTIKKTITAKQSRKTEPKKVKASDGTTIKSEPKINVNTKKKTPLKNRRLKPNRRSAPKPKKESPPKSKKDSPSKPTK